MAVAGEVARELSEALLDAYQPERLDQMLYYELGRDRARITMAGDYETVVFRLIRAADSEGWLPELVAAARRQRADHAGLLAVAQRMGLAVDSSSLERNVRRWIPDFDPVAWRERLGVLERQVCRIEQDTPTGAIACGTGFLVAPDLVLTNHHVVRDEPAHSIRCRFDYRRDAGGRLSRWRTIGLWHTGRAVPPTNRSAHPRRTS
jgi:Effector-associated domain 1